MKRSSVFALFICLLTSVSISHAAPQVHGDYIEARSASVYAGPCHYSNEAVTAGQNAILAWRIRGGAWNGVALENLSVAAVLTAQDNLAQDKTTRRSVLYLDNRATPQQAGALRSMFEQQYADVLGQIVAVNTAAVQVENDGLDYHVAVPGVLRLDVNRYPCSHCTQDAQIWYQPFVAASDIIVGKTLRTEYSAPALNVTWNDRQEANTAFVGQFAF